MLTRRLAPLLVLALAPAARADVCDPPHTSTVPPHERLEWPYPQGAENFGACEVARLTPYHGRSALVMWGAQLFVAYAPHVHELIVPVASDATAVAVLPRGGIDGLDAAVVAVATGLRLVVYHEAAPGGPAFVTTALPASASCANARALTCADLDGDGDADLAAADEDGLAVRTLLSDGAGGWAVGPTVATTSPLRSVEPIEWLLDPLHPGHELALLTDWGSEVFTIGGERLWGRFSTWPDHVMTVVRAPTSSTDPDRLAVVQRNAAGTNSLLVLHGAFGSEPALAIGDLGVVGLDAGDRDADGDEELVVSHRSGHTVREFTNRSGEGYNRTFGNAASVDLEIGNPACPAPDNTADPCCADVDDDGFAEVLIGAQDPHWLVLPTPGTPATGCPSLFSDYLIHLDGFLQGEYDPVAVGGELGVEVELANVWEDLFPSADHHLEVTIWKQAASVPTGLEPAPWKHVFYELPAAISAGELLRFGFTIEGTSANGANLEFLDKYFFELRPVVYTNGTISDPGRTYVGSLTGEFDNGSNVAGGSVFELWGSVGSFGQPCMLPTTEISNTYPPGGTELPGVYFGGMVPQRRLPKLPAFSNPPAMPPTEVAFAGVPQ